MAATRLTSRAGPATQGVHVGGLLHRHHGRGLYAQSLPPAGPACALAHSASVADVVLIYKVLQADSADSAAARKKNTVSLREAGTQIMRSHCYVNCACPPDPTPFPSALLVCARESLGCLSA